MTEKEFKNLKVGDKVRIVAKWAKPNGEGKQNRDGKMDKWLGKVMTIREFFTSNTVRMVEDKDEWASGWRWSPEMIAYKVSGETPTVVEHLIKGNKTIVKLSNGKVGVAQCAPEDEFDVYEGLRLATERAYEKCKLAKKTKSKVKEVKRPAEVGEYIKIVAAETFFRKSYYKNGDILKVYKIRDGVLGMDSTVFCELDIKENADSTIVRNMPFSFDNGNLTISPREYVVLEGYEPPVKEVKRAAKVGEYIKIVWTCLAAGEYEVGDIIKVESLFNKKGTVVIKSKYDKHDIHTVWPEEYVVLEGYKPDKK